MKRLPKVRSQLPLLNQLPQLTLKQVRLLRLFGLLLVFSLLVLYAVFRSPRFQEILRRRTERILTEATGRPVSIGGFDLALVPPAFLVRDVAVANDPRGVPGPAFSAAEVELRGIPSVTETRIDLPKLRVVSPRLVLEIFPDGTTNFSSLLERIPKGDGKGRDLRLGEAVIQHGTFRFREFRSRLDFVLRDAGLTARSSHFSRVTRLSVASPSLRFRLEESQVLEAGLGVDVVLSPGRVSVSRVALRSPDISITAQGGIADLAHPVLNLGGQVDFEAEALGKYFAVELPLSGRVAGQAFARIPFGSGYEVRGRFLIPDGRFGPFAISGGGSLRIDPRGLLVHAPEVKAFDGALGVFVHLPRMTGPPLPVRIAIDGRDLDFERFLGELGVPGTGLRARADLQTTLTFGPGGAGRADGSARLALRPEAGSRSLVKGRTAIPAGGGGLLAIRAGKILFPGTPIVTAGGAKVVLGGSIAIDGWTPDLSFDLEAQDLAEVERLAGNFYPALQGGEPLSPPLELAGSGRLTGRFERAFGDPRISGRLTASDFVLRGERFGETEATFTVDRDVLDLQPLLARDGDGSLRVTGTVGWGKAAARPGQYRLGGLVVEASRWPVERILGFLAFDVPLSGALTGTIPLEGDTPAIVGAGRLTWESGEAWGQPVDHVEGTLSFDRDSLALTDATALLGPGCLRGGGRWKYDGAYSFDLSAEGIRLQSLAAAAEGVPGLDAGLTGRVSGEGSLANPGFRVDLAVDGTSWEGHEVAPGEGPGRFEARLDGRSLNGTLSLGKAALLTVKSSRTGPEPGAVDTEVTLEVPRLAPFSGVFGLPPDSGLGGSVALKARVELDRATGEFRSLTGRVRDADVTIAGKRVRETRGASFAFRDGALRLDGLVIEEAAGAASAAGAGELAAGPGAGIRTSVALSGSISAEEPKGLDLRLKGALDAAFLNPFLPGGVRLSGPVAVDLAVLGTPGRPLLRGTARLDGVDLVTPGSATAVEGIAGTLRFEPGRVSTSDLTLRWDGAVDVAGNVSLDGAAISGIRLNARVSKLRAEPFPGLRCVLSGDLYVTGDSDVRLVAGELTMDSAVYAQDVDVSLGTILGRLGVGGAPRASAPGRFDAVETRIRLVSPPDGIVIRNNVARLRARGDAVLRGTMGRPILFGQFESEEGGRLTLRGQKYELLSAKLIFANPTRIDPYFEVSARTNIREYQVEVSVAGTMSKVVPRFSSEPPLSEAQIVSLLTSGDIGTRGPGGVSSPVGPSISTDDAIARAARELIAGLATDAATKRTKDLLKLDRLQIDPVFVGSAFDAPRLTIGKQIGRDLSVTYSYTASSNQQQLIVVEYQISPSAFLQFVRDELGVYAVDVKLRQRLR